MGLINCCPEPISTQNKQAFSGEVLFQEILKSTKLKDITFEDLFKILTQKDYNTCIENNTIQEDMFIHIDRYNEIAKKYLFKNSMMKNQYALIHLYIFLSIGISFCNEENLVNLNKILTVFLSMTNESFENKIKYFISLNFREELNFKDFIREYLSIVLLKLTSSFTASIFNERYKYRNIIGQMYSLSKIFNENLLKNFVEFEVFKNRHYTFYHIPQIIEFLNQNKFILDICLLRNNFISLNSN